MAHTADYFRARRRAQGVPERDGFDHPRFVAQGRQLHWLSDAPLHDLPWPRNLFCNNATIETDGRRGLLCTENRKIPGPTEVREPNLPHTANHAVARVTGDHDNRGVLWYCTMKCRNMHLV